MTTWLITGGAGFIGRNLIARLSRDPEIGIRVLDNESVGRIEDLQSEHTASRASFDSLAPPKHGEIQFLHGDILGADQCAHAAQDMDVIVHLAANTGVGPSVEDPESDCRTNVLGTLNMLQAARTAGTSRFVFASSGAPVGEVSPPIHERLAPKPVSPYGASKLAGEAYCSAFARTFEVHTVALRFGNVYGPRSSHKSSVVGQIHPARPRRPATRGLR